MAIISNKSDLILSMLHNAGFLYHFQPWNYGIGQSSQARKGTETDSIILNLIQKQKVLKECFGRGTKHMQSCRESNSILWEIPSNMTNSNCWRLFVHVSTGKQSYTKPFLLIHVGSLMFKIPYLIPGLILFELEPRDVHGLGVLLLHLLLLTVEQGRVSPEVLLQQGEEVEEHFVCNSNHIPPLGSGDPRIQFCSLRTSHVTRRQSPHHQIAHMHVLTTNVNQILGIKFCQGKVMQSPWPTREWTARTYHKATQRDIYLYWDIDSYSKLQYHKLRDQENNITCPLY